MQQTMAKRNRRQDKLSPNESPLPIEKASDWVTNPENYNSRSFPNDEDQRPIEVRLNLFSFDSQATDEEAIYKHSQSSQVSTSFISLNEMINNVRAIDNVAFYIHNGSYSPILSMNLLSSNSVVENEPLYNGLMDEMANSKLVYKDELPSSPDLISDLSSIDETDSAIVNDLFEEPLNIPNYDNESIWTTQLPIESHDNMYFDTDFVLDAENYHNVSSSTNNAVLNENLDMCTFPSVSNYMDKLMGDIQRHITTNGLVGLVNKNNICYINSLINCLRFCPPFLHNTIFGTKGNDLTNHMQALILKTWTSNSTLTTRRFYRAVCKADNLSHGYVKQLHEDAHEFFMFILEKLHNENKVPRTNFWPKLPKVEQWDQIFNYNNSFYNIIFYHQLETTFLCTYCTSVSTKYDHNSTIYIHFQDEEPAINVQQKVAEYLEPISEQTTAICSTCNSHCLIKRTISHYPSILVLNIVRYKFSQDDNVVTLINKDCEFQDEILFGNCKYMLNSISLHRGTPKKGHYTALCRHPWDKRWYEFNDSKFHEAARDSSKYRSQCYLLFYSILQDPAELNVDFFENEFY